jgi:hypothetical protein
MFIEDNRWAYTLSPEEEAICAEIGYQRQKPYFGNPQANRNYSEGDIWEMWQHCIAAGSELAFARMMGLNDFVPHVNKWRTEEDVKGVEIKYCFTSINKKQGDDFLEWSMRHNILDNPEGIYVLIVGGPENKKLRRPSQEYHSDPYIAKGWIYGSECRVPEFEVSFTNGRNWRVPYTSLHDMSSMPSLVKASLP